MNQERLMKIIKAPHVSEKASIAAEKNEYVLKVASDASKLEVKDAVEFLFSTKVKMVRIVNVRAKQKLFRGVEGRKKAWKKAYVTLQGDQKLEMIGTQ